ncbi:MAG: ATP-binding domain-containing protein, partial [Cyanobacteria bacterium P01_H01_bin.15]
NLNKVLQALINPPVENKPEINRGDSIFRVGDRVLQKVNDYEREVFNGDMGMISEIDLEEKKISVRFDNRTVIYDSADLNEIALAWAVTIHKSQGSEYPVILLPLFMQHFLMLNRNLLYTALTRAKKLAILLGPQKAIGLAIRQTQAQKRYTLLDYRISSQVSKGLEAGDRDNFYSVLSFSQGV